jgi:hypothetical protein
MRGLHSGLRLPLVDASGSGLGLLHGSHRNHDADCSGRRQTFLHRKCCEVVVEDNALDGVVCSHLECYCCYITPESPFLRHCKQFPLVHRTLPWAFHCSIIACRSCYDLVPMLLDPGIQFLVGAGNNTLTALDARVGSSVPSRPVRVLTEQADTARH